MAGEDLHVAQGAAGLAFDAFNTSVQQIVDMPAGRRVLGSVPINGIPKGAEA